MAFRAILPASLQKARDYPQAENSRGSQASPQARVTRSRRHTDAEWEHLRPLITQFYASHSLEETMKLVKEKMDFACGTRRFREKLSEWGLSSKKFDTDIIQIALSKKRKRGREEGIDTALIVNGVKIDKSRMSNLTKRQSFTTANHISPSAPTPDDILYYTPRAVSNIPNGQRSFHHTNMVSDVSNHEDNAPRTVLKITRIKYGRHKWNLPSLQRHPHHQIGVCGAVGSGRFRKYDRLIQCLWSITPIIKAFPSWSINLDNLHLQQPILITPDTPIRYTIRTHPDGQELNWNIQSLLKLLRGELFFRNLLALSKFDLARWHGDWHRVSGSTSDAIVEKFNTTFGDIFPAYPNTNMVQLAVTFETSDDVTSHTMLRVTLCHDVKKYVKSCQICDSKAVAVDLDNLDGTISIRFTPPNSTVLDSWSTYDAFKSALHTRSEQSYNTHTELIGGFTGWTEAHGRNKCRCGCVYDYDNPSSHFINIAEDEAENAVWDDQACVHQEQPFNPFPMETNPDEYGFEFDSQGESSRNSDTDEDESWDPTGANAKLEEFVPAPTQNEEHSYNAVVYMRKHALRDRAMDNLFEAELHKSYIRRPRQQRTGRQ